MNMPPQGCQGRAAVRLYQGFVYGSNCRALQMSPILSPPAQ